MNSLLLIHNADDGTRGEELLIVYILYCNAKFCFDKFSNVEKLVS